MNFFCTFNVSNIKTLFFYFIIFLGYTSLIITEIVTRDMDSITRQPFIKLCYCKINCSIARRTGKEKTDSFRILFLPQARPMLGNPRQSYILDSTPWILDSRYWIPDSLFVELGSRIPIVGGIRIPWAVFGIPHSKAQDFRYSTSKNFPYSGLSYVKWPSRSPVTLTQWSMLLSQSHVLKKNI